MSSVATLTGFQQAGTFERHVGLAIEYCTEAGLSRQLSEELKDADLIGQCALFIRSTPWKRHPATVALKKIYALLMVLFFVSRLYIETNQHTSRRTDVLVSMNLTLTQD